MNRDLMILLKYISENVDKRNHYSLKLDETVSAFNQKKSKLEQKMAMEERLLKDEVSQ